MKLLKKYKEYVSRPEVATWYIFGLLGLVLFTKNVLFNWLCFSSEENYFMSLVMALPQKIVPALLIASFLFITKRPIWTIVANLLVDTWIIANLFYFKANGYFLAYEVMTMVGNMDGFWDSLWSYMGWDIAIFPILTLVYSLLIPYNNDTPKKYKHFVLLAALALVINIGDQALHKAHKAVQVRKTSSAIIAFSWSECLPFSHVYTYADAEWVDYNYWAKQYVQKFSIVSYFPACLMYRCISPMEKLENISIEASRIQPFLNGRQEQTTSRTNIVFILVESLESWPLDPVGGVNFMPNLNAIMRDEHALCCRNVKSQTVNGNSGDGQLIDMTGLLPITDGVVCNSYYRNTYPSIAQCYNQSAIINPSPGVWNQEQMTKVYHFDELIEPNKKEKWQDADVANRVIQYMDTASQPFCLLGITISSHVPFAYGSEHPKHIIDGMPNQLNAYLNCLAYADSCIGAIYHHIVESPELANSTTLVISGDHTIFRSYNKEFDYYAAKAQFDFRTTKTYTPLIVYSPSIENNIQISDTCFQMDIYPTMMGLVGCKDYYWKGFGVDLAQPNASASRQISEEEAYQISSQLIKSNWFASMFSSNRYIAHAGGSIDGNYHTNCLEAVEHALSQGINMIELDLCLTSDSCIVAAHDLGHFHEITGCEGDSAAISLSEFSQRKILGRYTPITLAMIDSLMTVYPTMYLVTDKLSSPMVLSQFQYRSRIIVEAFDMDDYCQLDTMGFFKVFYSRSPQTKYRVLYNKLLNVLALQPTSPIPTRYVYCKRQKQSDYRRAYGDEFAIFSVKNRQEADSLIVLDDRIKYVYIDETD